jgi:putative endonuclease
MKHFFYVYILASDTEETVHYTGVTQNLRGRLSDHNRGACSHSAKYRHWHLVTAIAFRSEIKARAFERYLKSGSGREFARRHF